MCFASTSTKHKHKAKKRPVCSMELSDKDDGGNSSSGDYVTPEQAEILELLEENSQALKAQDRMLEKAAKKLRKLKPS